MGGQLEECHSLRAVLCFVVFNSTTLILILGLSMKPQRLLPFYFPDTVIIFVCLFTFLVALSCLLTPMKQIKPGQTLCSTNTLPSWFLQCGFPPLRLPVCCGWLSRHLCYGYLGLLSYFFAVNEAATSLKWLETYHKTVRNRKSLILMLLSAGFSCTCCSDFPGHRCFCFTCKSSKFCFLSSS